MKKLVMLLCSLAICVGFIGAPTNSITADAASTRTRKIKVSSPQAMGTYKVYLVTNNKEKYIGESKLSFGNITFSGKANITVDKRAKVHVRIKYNGPGKVVKNSGVATMSETQLKYGISNFTVTVNKAGVVSTKLH